MAEAILLRLSSVDMGLAIALVAFLMFLNSSLMAPPSELICLVAGYWASTSGFPLSLIVLIAAASNLAGTSLWYHLGLNHRRKALNRGRSRGGQLVDRLFILLTGRDVDYFLIRFERSGWILIVLLRLVPVARSIISYGAGQANMRYGIFYAGSFVGILVWCATWSWAGYFYGLNSNTTSVMIVFLVFSAGSVAAWVIQRKLQL